MLLEEKWRNTHSISGTSDSYLFPNEKSTNQKRLKIISVFISVTASLFCPYPEYLVFRQIFEDVFSHPEDVRSQTVPITKRRNKQGKKKKSVLL